MGKKRNNKRKIMLPFHKREKIRPQYFSCYCTCCGKEWSETTTMYKSAKHMIECPDCGSIYYEADHPKFPETLEERLGQLGLPLKI